MKFKLFEAFSDRLDYGIHFNPSSFVDAVVVKQVHQDHVAVIHKKPSFSLEVDALISQKKNLPLMVRVADCQGLIIYDSKKQAIAVVHSGWKGSVLNIIRKTIFEMKTQFDSNPNDLYVAIGPSLGPCCAKFSDPKNELPEFCQPFVAKSNYVDFWALSIQQCKEAGIKEDHIEILGECSQCNQKYFSHRNGDSERMGIFAILK